VSSLGNPKRRHQPWVDERGDFGDAIAINTEHENTPCAKRAATLKRAQMALLRVAVTMYEALYQWCLGQVNRTPTTWQRLSAA
jgi:hypothetical protein